MMRNEMKAEGVARPYWHVDAKWVTGILLFIILSVTLATFFLSRLTSRENAIELSTLVLATVFSREEGLDGTASIEEIKKELANHPGDTIQPIPEIPAITVTKQDVKTLSPRELRLKIFRQIVEPFYDEGAESAAKRFTDDPAAQEKFVNDASMLRFLTASAHQQISSVFYILLAVSLLLLAAFIYFSFGWGRFGNPGALLFLIGLPGAFVGFFLKNPPPDGDGGLFKYLPREVSSELGSYLQMSYGVVFLVGLLLLTVALFGSVISRSRHRTETSETTQQQTK